MARFNFDDHAVKFNASVHVEQVTQALGHSNIEHLVDLASLPKSGDIDRVQLKPHVEVDSHTLNSIGDFMDRIDRVHGRYAPQVEAGRRNRGGNTPQQVG